MDDLFVVVMPRLVCVFVKLPNVVNGQYWNQLGKHTEVSICRINDEIRPYLVCVTLSVLKVVKQTVMTSVYGVTFVGARKQIQSVLGDKIANKTQGSGVSLTNRCGVDAIGEEQLCLFWAVEQCCASTTVRWIELCTLP